MKVFSVRYVSKRTLECEVLVLVPKDGDRNDAITMAKDSDPDFVRWTSCSQESAMQVFKLR